MLNAEQAHLITFKVLKLFKFFPFLRIFINGYRKNGHENHQKNIFGVNFKNTLGLAAGFDKNAELVDILAELGFGFIEIGTVTPLPQPGNPKPRLFRLPRDRALINRMGFNNDGVKKIKERLEKRKTNIVIGGNIGKNKWTSNEEAFNDYIYCFKELFHIVDYFVINVSSPNTPDLRKLQEKEPLKQLLYHLQKTNNKMALESQLNQKPLFLKISPDLSENAINEIVEIVSEANLSGIVATNTTISRENLYTKPGELDKAGNGGLSGKPLSDISNNIIKQLKTKTNNDIVIIGAGGVFNYLDYQKKINAGADLVQLYTGFIYEGPGIVKQILR